LRAACSTLFPYTTLFRSVHAVQRATAGVGNRGTFRQRRGAPDVEGVDGVAHRLLVAPEAPGNLRDRNPVGTGLHDLAPSECEGIDRKSTRLNSSHQIISY